jgi:hypothetical protein
LVFWKRAVRTFRGIEDEQDSWESEIPFCEKACLIIADAGASVSQLLGQKASRDDQDIGRVPWPRDIFKDSIRDWGLEDNDLPRELRARFKELMDCYDHIRHFGSPYEECIFEIDGELLCRLMNTAQDVWRVFVSMGERGELFAAGEYPDYLSHTFTFDEPNWGLRQPSCP